MASLTRELGIDLGTNFTVFAQGQEIMIHEPTTVAILIDEWKIIEWGQTAKDMFGRVPEDIEVIAMYVMNQDFDKSVLHKDTIPGFAEFFWRDMPMVYSDETFALIGERTGCCLCKENVVVEKTWFRRYFNK